MSSKYFIPGMLVGLAVSAAAVLLTTPKSGQQVRLALKENAKIAKLNLVDVNQQVTNVKQSISSFTKEVKNNIPTIINDVKNSIDSFAKDIEPNTNQLKSEIENLNSSMNEIKESMEKFQKKS